MEAKAFGDKGARIQTTLIDQEQGYLGTFSQTLQPGDTQSLVFTSSVNGLFWMSDAEREDCRHDKLFGTLNPVKLTNTEMKQDKYFLIEPKTVEGPLFATQDSSLETC